MPRLILLLSLFTIITLAVHANDTETRYDPADYPTLAAVAEATLPVADTFDIARRLRGITDIPAPPQSAPEQPIGAREQFFVSNSQTNNIVQVEAVLRAIGAHVLVWVDTDSRVTDQAAQGFADRFDTEVYETVRNLWGSEPNPGIDGDARVYVLFTTATSPDIAGYFTGRNTYPRAISPTSNERNMLTFNSRAFNSIDDDATIRIAVHEFQHMIRRAVDPQDAAWVDEGLSMLTEHLLGDPPSAWALEAFAQRPETQLNRWGIAEEVRAEYGAGLFFMLYVYERFGLELVQAIANHPANGIDAVDTVLRERESIAVDTVFADWVLTNFVRCLDCGYGYTNLPANTIVPPVRGIAPQVPYALRGESPPYATNYFRLIPRPDALTLELDIPDTVRIIPADASSGTHFWCALRGDDSNPRLTRAFDLRNVTQATLNYRVWYDIEPFWDYAYISISTDGGQTWQIQPTSLTTEANPNGRSIGTGYTGESKGWQTEALVLDSFAGQEILVRFEVITDDSVARVGFALDDVALLATGYFSDFEADGGGWQAEGWIRTDNRVPLQTWVQAIQILPNGIEVQRWLAHGHEVVSLDLWPATQDVFVAVSPYAPLTDLPVAFTLLMR